MTKWPRAFYFGLCVLGIILSSYAYYVEQKAQSKGYNGSLCDFGAGISCTTVLTSKYERRLSGYVRILANLQVVICDIFARFAASVEEWG